MSRRAILLAGGQGTRLRPYTIVLPKPLVPVGDYPILEIVIRQLVSRGFDHLTIAVNHKAELIRAFFGNGERWNVRIDYSLEDKPLGTMGPLCLIDDLPEHFLVMNGDILTDLDYAAFHDEHASSRSEFTISSYVREHRIDYGVLETNKGTLRGFREKPTSSFEVSMGVYMMSRSVLPLIPSNTFFGFDSLMLAMLAAKRRVAVRRFAGYWLDIGRAEDYAQAVDEFAAMERQFLDG